MRRLIARAKRWEKTPADLVGLTGWQAYLWDQACDWLYCYDMEHGQKKDETKDTSFTSFGAYG